jgi:hypothetical protein
MSPHLSFSLLPGGGSGGGGGLAAASPSPTGLHTGHLMPAMFLHAANGMHGQMAPPPARAGGSTHGHAMGAGAMFTLGSYPAASGSDTDAAAANGYGSTASGVGGKRRRAGLAGFTPSSSSDDGEADETKGGRGRHALPPPRKVVSGVAE